MSNISKVSQVHGKTGCRDVLCILKHDALIAILSILLSISHILLPSDNLNFMHIVLNYMIVMKRNKLDIWRYVAGGIDLF